MPGQMARMTVMDSATYERRIRRAAHIWTAAKKWMVNGTLSLLRNTSHNCDQDDPSSPFMSSRQVCPNMKQEGTWKGTR